MTPAALVDDLTRPMRHGEHLEARGLVLHQPLILDGLAIRGFDLSNARLLGGISARGTRFLGLTWFRQATIEGRCDFGGASFRTDVRADGLIAGDVDLRGAQVLGVLSFAGARLRNLALGNAVVMANMTLENAVITGAVDLAGTEILGGVWTAGAQIAAMNHQKADISGRVRLPG